MSGFADILLKFAEICARHAIKWPALKLVMWESKWSGDILWTDDRSYLEVVDDKPDITQDQEPEALGALDAVSRQIIRVLHRAGADFDTPMGKIRDQFDEPDAWKRLLFFAGHYTEAYDVLDWPQPDLNYRELWDNPFTASQYLLIEIAGRLRASEKASDIIASIIKQPRWPRYIEPIWDEPDDEDSPNPPTPCEKAVEAVRKVIAGSPRMKQAAILDELRRSHVQMGPQRLQSVLDYIRKRYPNEYAVPPRRRKADS